MKIKILVLCLGLLFPVYGLEEDDPFAEQPGEETPAEALRKITRKMKRIEEDMEKVGERQAQEKNWKVEQFFRSTSLEQGEIEELLAELVLRLQKEQEQNAQSTPIPMDDSGSSSSKSKSQPQNRSKGKLEQESSMKRKQEKPQQTPGGEEPKESRSAKDSPSEDPANDMYRAYYEHKARELLKSKDPGSSRPWGLLPERERKDMIHGQEEKIPPGYEDLVRRYFDEVEKQATQ